MDRFFDSTLFSFLKIPKIKKKPKDFILAPIEVEIHFLFNVLKRIAGI